jgi:hypothetical protein
MDVSQTGWPVGRVAADIVSIDNGRLAECIELPSQRFAGHAMREMTFLEYNFANSV